ncbi:MAG: hypothetical protein SGJ21_03260 [Alphaproteobacteria bacterium]|nr:hypothetical protein [Alphaproteobacteria bacterium]
MSSTCAVAVLLPAFRLGLDQLNERVSREVGASTHEIDDVWAGENEAWEQLWLLGDAALHAKPSSDIGQAMQLAVAIDAVEILRCCKMDDDRREDLCIKVQSTLRNVLSRMDLKTVSELRAAGLVSHYVRDDRDLPGNRGLAARGSASPAENS